MAGELGIGVGVGIRLCSGVKPAWVASGLLLPLLQSWVLESTAGVRRCSPCPLRGSRSEIWCIHWPGLLAPVAM